ncbi:MULTISPECIES: hypothetical protein [unclassified Actinopolyspora]|uniref:hypothetical protein n=1 Tax=unclassified Actinopolyspora TaxID=2639451 RepID=UPI001DACB098|nr:MULTISPECIES: hypothetical protein [unclassified Actinopolyspora]NHD15641.1 hypothetical protein [Actinopolyspora sp. BKK2]NHE75146.1 hypothetical protein [Actinopolyspora sp. BKK1]
MTNVEAIGDESPRFKGFTDDGQWATRSIVLATGLDDELPDADLAEVFTVYRTLHRDQTSAKAR